MQNSVDEIVALMECGHASEWIDRVEIRDCDVVRLGELQGGYGELLEDDIITVFIDGVAIEHWGDLQEVSGPVECWIRVTKSHFLRKFSRIESDGIGKYIFIKKEFLVEWFARNRSPFKDDNLLHNHDQVVFYVNGLESSVSGKHIAVVPTSGAPSFYEGALPVLPHADVIRRHVNVMAAAGVIIDPSRFYVPYQGRIDDIVTPVFYWYWMSLAASLVKEFYGENKVVLTGIRRISLPLMDGDIAGSSAIEALEEAVEWVYVERTETRLLLLMDRISLDVIEGGPLLPSLFSCVKPALEQAKYRYEFVIKDRKEAHAKELADLQKDVRTATDHYSKLTNDLVSGMLRDAISSVFILSIVLFSRLLGNASEQIGSIKFLFWGLAGYLAVSLIVRLVYSCQSMRMAKDDLAHWRDAVRNHMSRSELDSHINGRCKKYAGMYHAAAVTVSVIYVVLIVLVVSMPRMLLPGVDGRIEKEVRDEILYDVDNVDEAVEVEEFQINKIKQPESKSSERAASPQKLEIQDKQVIAPVEYHEKSEGE